MKSGFVSLVGRPNVGKSTLLNSIIGKKVAITSDKPQTTRNMIQGILTTDDTQIVFVDTPGVHKPKNKLGDYLNKQAYYSFSDVDVILFLIDITESLGRGDMFILNKLKEVNKPVILVMNKVDKIKKEEILIKINEYKDLFDFKEIVPLSALKHDNITSLIKAIKPYLKDDFKYYLNGEYTNQRREFLISEIVREKIFNKTKEEVPHSTTCVVEQIKKDKNSYLINVAIIVNRDSLKKIIIGKNGSKLKEIGTESRLELENILGSKIYLELFVKVVKNWTDKEKYLQELGFKDFLE